MSVNTSAPVWRGAMFIAAAAVAWGTGGAVAMVLYRTSGLGPIAVSFWRFVVAVIALAALQAATKRATAPVRWRSAALTGGGLAIYLTAYFGSVHYSGVAVGTLVTLGIGPVLIALGAHYLLGEHLTRWQAAAIAVALAGLIMLAAGSGEAGSNPMLGIALAFVSAAGYSAVTLYTRAGHAQGANLPVFAIGMVCLAPIAIGEGCAAARR